MVVERWFGEWSAKFGEPAIFGLWWQAVILRADSTEFFTERLIFGRNRCDDIVGAEEF